MFFANRPPYPRAQAVFPAVPTEMVCAVHFSTPARSPALNIHTKIVVGGFRRLPEYL
jgi:hypothetical protein